MSKYIARYTHVEGNPEVGDWYHSKFRSENKFFYYAQWESPDTFYFEHTQKEDFISKVELYLCEGDTIIGLISPNAKFVNHGDKFEEHEVKLWKQAKLKESTDDWHFIEDIEEGEVWLEIGYEIHEYIPVEKLDIRTICNIKCKCCDKFS